jgi:hypothetical protein
VTRLEIDELTIRVPGLSRDDAHALAGMIAEELAAGGRLGVQGASLGRLSVTIGPGSGGRQDLARRATKAIIDAIAGAAR